ncbi:Nn.00g019920.m01.CDS01 [Neocucurbitaria sp. VM-36]
MDKAKAAITDFMGRSGHHDTTVHEAVAPAVKHETIKPHQHEEINTAIDKEVHQDHYHRTVQPVHDREVLPETHTAKLGGVQHREFDHRDHDSTKRNLVEDQARFKDERRIEGHTTSQSVAPTVGGEHVHHHIHETIQPVIQKEVIQPNVVHTTVPIHEVHHNKATHHDTTSLPAMTMDQFKAKGGALTGREERYDEFQGVPKNIGGGTAGGFGAVRGLEHKEHHNSKEHSRHGDYHDAPNHQSTGEGIQKGGLTNNSTTAGTAGGLTGSSTSGGLTGSNTSGGLAGHRDNQHHADRGIGGQGNLTGSSTQGGIVGSSDRHHDGTSSTDLNDPSRDRSIGATGTTSSSGGRKGTDGVISGTGKGDLDHRANEDGGLPKALTEDRSKAEPHSSLHDNQHSAGHKTHDSTTGTNTHKPSLMDKLNPKVDANGDGKAGFMK